MKISLVTLVRPYLKIKTVQTKKVEDVALVVKGKKKKGEKASGVPWLSNYFLDTTLDSAAVVHPSRGSEALGQ